MSSKSFQWRKLYVEKAGSDLEHPNVAAHHLDVVYVRERIDELTGILVDLQECENTIMILASEKLSYCAFD